jgi:oxygen-independent coproporphyrinogen-3 oxidase
MDLQVMFDPELMRRYDREGPRYTSYPTALQFREDLNPLAYQRATAASAGARNGSPLSIYVHVPFCQSPCFYCGCNKEAAAAVPGGGPPRGPANAARRDDDAG